MQVEDTGQVVHRFECSFFFYSHYQRTRRIWEVFAFFLSLSIVGEIFYILVVPNTLSFIHCIPSLIIDASFIIDYYVLFHTVFFKDLHEVDQPKLIKENYGLFAAKIYFISILPLSWIGIVAKNKIVYAVLNIHRLCRLHRGIRAFKTIRSSLLYIGQFLQVLPYFGIYFFIVHMYAVGFLSFTFSEVSWKDEFTENYTHSELYVISLYYTLNTCSAVGTGYIHPVTKKEQLFSLFGMFIGCSSNVLLSCVLVAYFFDSTESDFLSRYAKTNKFMKGKSFSKELQSEFHTITQFRYSSSGIDEDIADLLDELPPIIRERVIYQLARPLFECESAQNGFFKMMNYEEHLKVAHIMRRNVIFPENIILNESVNEDCLLYIQSGIFSFTNSEKVVSVQEANSNNSFVWGQLLTGTNISNTIKAVTIVTVWVLQRDDFFDLLRIYPEMQEKVECYVKESFPDSSDQILRRMHFPSLSSEKPKNEEFF